MAIEKKREHIPSLAASRKKTVVVLDLNRARTLTITSGATYHGSATGAVRINLYHSPDEKNYDTVPFTYFDVTLTAGEEVQRTVIIDSPEEGDLQIEVENTDTVYAATNVMVWYRITNWSESVTGAD